MQSVVIGNVVEQTESERETSCSWDDGFVAGLTASMNILKNAGSVDAACQHIEKEIQEIKNGR